jgi:8-oxo-dGTP pyrophosphatase MutT (NUDIX family)
MCGGIIFNLDKINRQDLEEYYTGTEVDEFLKKGQATSLYWQANPVLPVVDGGKTYLRPWGNRDRDSHLPQTGWAKLESLNEGKWNNYQPRYIWIPAIKGYEKGLWFDSPKNGYTGVIVGKDKNEHAYMVTAQASQEYLNLTKHNREPVPTGTQSVICAGGIVYRQGKKGYEALLMKNKGRLNWIIPKGHVESNEGIKDAALREIAEETGFEGGEVDRLLGSYPRLVPSTNKFKTTYYYLIQPKTDASFKPENAESNTIEVKWIPLDGAIDFYLDEQKEVWKRAQQLLS